MGGIVLGEAERRAAAGGSPPSARRTHSGRGRTRVDRRLLPSYTYAPPSYRSRAAKHYRAVSGTGSRLSRSLLVVTPGAGAHAHLALQRSAP